MQLSESHWWLLRAYWPVVLLSVFVLVVAITQLEGVQTQRGTVDGAGPDVSVPEDRLQGDADDQPEGRILGRLWIPVAGVQAEDLYDSYTDARGAEREHQAIDIMADRGSPVRAAAPGIVAEIHASGGGGKSIYKLGPDSSYVFYYAHFDEYAEGLEIGSVVQQGEMLGTVGSSGNAHERAPHLHFAIWEVDDPESIWQGEAINPYPLLGGE